MKRRWNMSLWLGVLILFFGLGSYVPLFSRFPLTRDFPWANILLLLVGGFFMARGLTRAFRQPDVYRGRILGTGLAVLCLVGCTLFVYGLFYLVRQIPPSPDAPKIGQKAPDFSLPDQNGKAVALSELISSGAQSGDAKPRGALLIFYRGHW